LEEYYEAETTFANESDPHQQYLESHDKALEFESKVLSDYTGVSEQKRVTPQSSDPKHATYVYTTVEYDVTRKTGIKDNTYSTIQQITKTKRP
jgi:hypothetical protein